MGDAADDRPAGPQRSSLPAIDIGDDGKIAITYVGSETPGKKEEKWRWNGYITMTEDALAEEPRLLHGNDERPDDPLQIGECGDTRCHTLGDFFDVTIAPGRNSVGRVRRRLLQARRVHPDVRERSACAAKPSWDGSSEVPSSDEATCSSCYRSSALFGSAGCCRRRARHSTG